MIMGDFNSTIETTENDDHLREVMRRYGLGERNRRGEIPIKFYAQSNLFVANSNYKHHKRRLYTWTSDGLVRNQIDYVLI